MEIIIFKKLIRSKRILKLNMWVYPIAVVILAMIASAPIHVPQAAAETKVLLAPIMTDEMYELIRQNDVEFFDGIVEEIMEDENLSHSDANAQFRKYNLAAAEFDFDEDGTPELIPELITVIAHSRNCGSAGCMGYLYENIDGKWISRGGGITVYNQGNPNGTGFVIIAILDDRRWHYYAPAHPKFKRLQEKYGK